MSKKGLQLFLTWDNRMWLSIDAIVKLLGGAPTRKPIGPRCEWVYSDIFLKDKAYLFRIHHIQLGIQNCVWLILNFLTASNRHCENQMNHSILQRVSASSIFASNPTRSPDHESPHGNTKNKVGFSPKWMVRVKVHGPRGLNWTVQRYKSERSCIEVNDLKGPKVDSLQSGRSQNQKTDGPKDSN